MFAWYQRLSSSQRRTFWACFGGWGLDAMDFQLYPFVIPSLIALWKIKPDRALEDNGCASRADSIDDAPRVSVRGLVCWDFERPLRPARNSAIHYHLVRDLHILLRFCADV